MKLKIHGKTWKSEHQSVERFYKFKAFKIMG